ATVLELARQRNARLGTAESCTGGLVAAALTEVPGSSDVFFGAVVSYDNSVKEAALGVPAQVLESVGAVSEECALAMAEGARRCLGVDLAVSTSGIAGPGGGSPDKPVGLVCFAVAGLGRHTASTRHFTGDRATIRHQACQYALELLQQALDGRN
ncbi:MAG: CinA family protein, partial [Coriobacteriia bacterium]|nr:CinA family protein [Coriobacteriia bacterium]